MRAQSAENPQGNSSTPPPAQAPAPPAAGRLPAAASPVTSPPLPTPFVPKSPVAFFRELLAMDLPERRKALAGRTPEDQRLILAKVREYESLRPDLRELRLRVTELRWYLWPLMNADPANRAGRLAQIPEPTRALVEARLQEWDKLPPTARKQLLENEAAIRYFTELRDNPNQRLSASSEARRKKLEQGIHQWQALPQDQRQQIASRFDQFFGLNSEEKEKALKTLSEPERAQIEKTLRGFGHLTPTQRAQCIRSFEKFASLSPQDRHDFLKDAERWKLMTPDERQAWRDLVKMAPLLPVPQDQAPLPATSPTHPHQRQVATNGG